MRGLIRIVRILFFLFIAVLAIKGFFSFFGREKIKEAIYILKLEDTILSSEKIVNDLRNLEKSDFVKAIILRINSPGGTIGASQEIYLELKRFKEKTGKKLVCSIENVGASGAYYVSLACDKVIALPGSIVGSIGVISLFFTVEDLLKYLKVKPYIVKSGKFKDTGSPFRQPNEQDMKYLEDIVVKLFQQFKKDVVEVRPALKDKIDEIADGRVFTGKEALELGLIDYVGTFSDAVTVAKELAGIKEEPKLIFPEKRKIPFLDDILKSAKEEIISKFLFPQVM
ncbi:MAG: signal peptide peptidase SppA [Candidatus Calescibacterium sp.]|jgi:protease-4